MSNTTTRTRKAAAATKTATANITAARKATAKKATAKKVAAAPAQDKPKGEQTFEERDWTYLDEKDPSEQHVLLAKEINRRTEEINIDAKQVQAVLAMFPHFQRSATNKNRSQYRPLAAEIVEKRSEHMTLAHKEAREIMDGLQIEVAKKTAPATKKAAAKAPAKKATATKPVATPAPAKKAPARKARVTKKTAAAPAATEAF